MNKFGLNVVCLKEQLSGKAHTGPGKPGKSAIFTKSQGKPGIVREISVIFIQVKETSRKKNCSVHI